MPDPGPDIRGIPWTQWFPFVRLFRSFGLARMMNHLGLGLLCVVAIYLSGRLLDAIWVGAGSGVVVSPDGRQSEVEVYAVRGPEELVAWRTQTSAARKESLERAADEVTDGGLDEARRKLESSSAHSLVKSAKQPKIDEARRIIAERERAGLDAISRSANEKDPTGKRRALMQSADYLRLVLNRNDASSFATPAVRDGAVALIRGAGAAEAAANPTTQQAQAAEKHTRDNATLDEALAAAETLRAIERSAPRGPFATLLDYESNCFAQAIRAVCALRLSYAGSAMSETPSLLGSIASAGHGVTWLLFYRPWFGLLFGLLALVLAALGCGAIARSAAVQAARDESISLGEALRFAREKLVGLVLAPVIPLAIFAVLAIFLVIGGLIGAIPWLGDLLAGGFYVLALLGGFGLALVLIALVLGFNLLWPTIAVEGSDAFDAITHAGGYVSQRIWHYAWYMLVLLTYGGVCFVGVRLIAILMLKLTHAFTGIGMSFFGVFSSAETSTISKLDAIWRMPAWSDISVLPSAGGANFWGTLGNAPLGIGETLGYWLIAFWVFIVVGLVCAFLLSFSMCGSTLMYILLRKEVDATDYDEIFYEEGDDLHAEPAPAPAAAAEAESKGTSLPVVGGSGPPQNPPGG